MVSNIALERFRAGLKQTDLAERLGTSPGVISRWERGRVTPNGQKLIAMSNLFGCSIDYLLGMTEERNIR